MSDESSNSHIRYRPEIDGLRAVAVVPVILFHWGFGWIPGGFAGVDVFFVISGFLIAAIIIREFEEERFTLRDFWMRRVRRILPMLITVTVTFLAIAVVTCDEGEHRMIATQGLAALLSVANFSHMKLAGNYWGEQAEGSFFLHAWSLSVEEQFYLLLPVILLAVLRYARRHLQVVAACCVVVSLLAFLWGTAKTPTTAFYMLPFRAWELGTGVCLATIVTRIEGGACKNRALSVVGLLLVCASFFCLQAEKLSALMIMPVAGTALLIAYASHDDDPVVRCLRHPAVVYVGKISYSLYLWHWPVFVLCRRRMLVGPSALIYILPLVFLLSILSYHFIEGKTRRNRRLTPWIIGALCLAIGGAAWLRQTSATASEVPGYTMPGWEGERYNVTPRPDEPTLIDHIPGLHTSRNAEAPFRSGGKIYRYGGATPEIMVLGDSHAMMWGAELDQAAKACGRTISFCAANTDPGFFDIPVRRHSRTSFFLEDEKFEYDQARLKYLRQWRPKLVVIAIRWSLISDVRITEQLMRLLEEQGAQVLLVEQLPELQRTHSSTARALYSADVVPVEGEQYYLPPKGSTDYERGRSLVRQLAEQYEFCAVLPTADAFLNEEGDVLALDGLNVLYIDDNHIGAEAAARLRDRITTAICAYFDKDYVPAEDDPE
jgi:peptidoglycan/LPS O-acetylase OafA/YrhL